MKNERGVAIIAVVVVVVILVGVGGILLLNRPDSENKTDQIINGNNQSKEEGVDIEKQDVLVGFSLSPKSYTEADFLTFLSKADEGGNALTFAGDVFNLSDGQAGPELVMTLSTSYNYTPIILVSDPQAEHILPFVTEYKPPFLGIGVEINRNRIETIDDFADKFSSVYDQIKESSPDTTVFVSFQLENMKGLDGGLFGNENNPDNNQWHLVDLFFKSDLIGFTTYPGLIYQNPSDIPVDYYSSISTHVDKPIAFVEIGWPSRTVAPEWESSQAEQVEFINRFFELSDSLDTKLFIWPFLYDQDYEGLPEPFKSMGLFDLKGSEKESWVVWREQAGGLVD